jgi:hypothetical protein
LSRQLQGSLFDLLSSSSKRFGVARRQRLLAVVVAGLAPVDSAMAGAGTSAAQFC